MKRYHIFVWCVALLVREPLHTSHRGGGSSRPVAGVSHGAGRYGGSGRLNIQSNGVYSTRAGGYSRGVGLYPVPITPVIQPGVVVANPVTAVDTGYYSVPSSPVVIVDQPAVAQVPSTVVVQPSDSNNVVVNPSSVNVTVSGAAPWVTAQPAVAQTISAADFERYYLQRMLGQDTPATIQTTLSSTQINITPANLKTLSPEQLGQIYNLVEKLDSGTSLVGKPAELKQALNNPHLTQLMVDPQTIDNCGIVSMMAVSNYIRTYLQQPPLMLPVPSGQWHDASELEQLWQSTYGRTAQGVQIPVVYLDAHLTLLGDIPALTDYEQAHQTTPIDFVANRIAQALAQGIPAYAVFINTGSQVSVPAAQGGNAYHWFGLAIIQNTKAMTNQREYVLVDSFGARDISVNGQYILSGTAQGGMVLNASRLQDTSVQVLVALVEQYSAQMRSPTGKV